MTDVAKLQRAAEAVVDCWNDGQPLASVATTISALKAALSPQTLPAPGEVESMAQTLEVHAETRRLCGQFGVADEIDAAAKMLRSLATDEGVFAIGDRVEKIKGSSWCGIIVGTYSTKLTPEGYAVESEREPGSVQIYPAAAIRLLSQGGGGGVRTKAQSRGAAVQKARARLRYQQVCQHSEAGSTKQEAAAAIGITVGGIDSMLYRELGTTAWPLATSRSQHEGASS